MTDVSVTLREYRLLSRTDIYEYRQTIAAATPIIEGGASPAALEAFRDVIGLMGNILDEAPIESRVDGRDGYDVRILDFFDSVIALEEDNRGSWPGAELAHLVGQFFTAMGLGDNED